jgi:hypothetical protein
MSMKKLKGAALVLTAAVALTASGSLVHPQDAAQKGEQSKNELTPENFERLLAAIKPQPGECPWDEIPWLTDLWAARKQAAAQDKPILMFGNGGAGFNDSLGTC